jgi:uncharacterized membrane protein
MDIVLFLMAVVLAWLVWQLVTLRERVRRVEEELWRAQRFENPPVATPEATPPPLPKEVPAIEEDWTPRFVAPEPVFHDPVSPDPVVTLAERLRAMLGNQEWEMLVGGSLLNKLGALVLVIGIALFMGYSFGHITPAGRAAMATAVSIALLGAGIRVERKGQFQVFSRGLIGAGWAALYATAYAIYAIPEARVIQNPLAGSMGMLLVAVGMIWHSLRYRAQAVTAVAYFAAFAAMAVTPSSPFAVVSLIPLAASLLYLAWRFEWYSMALFGLAATYLTCISRGSSDAPLAATQALFIAYWLMFEAFDWLRMQRRASRRGLDFLFPLNSACFISLSFLAWSSKAPEDLWLAAAFGAILFLADALVRAAVRPPASFDPQATLQQKLQAGSYEGAFLIAAGLAALAVVGKVPGVWAGVGLACEAEIVYLAGLRLRSSFLRRLGARAFAVSILQTLTRSEAQSKTLVLGLHNTWNWTPPMLFHAALFYLNRILRQPNAIMSSAAALIVACVLAAELPAVFVGTGLILFGLLLFELGLRKQLLEFRAQSWVALAAGLAFTALPNLDTVQDQWLPLTISTAALYLCALRTRWMNQIDGRERTWFALSISGGAALLASFLVWRVAPSDYVALAWCVLAVMLLEFGSAKLPAELRVCFPPMAILATLGVLVREAGSFAKFPPFAVSATWGGAFIAALAAAARLSLRPPVESREWERKILRDAISALACAAGLSFTWLITPDPWVSILWTALVVLLHETATALRLRSLRLISLGALAAVYLRVFEFDLDSAPLAVPFAIAGIYWIWHRSRRLPWAAVPAALVRILFWAALPPVLALIEREAYTHGAPAGWALAALVLLFTGIRFQLLDARLQSYAVAFLAFAGAVWYDVDPPRLWTAAIVITAFYAGQWLAGRAAEQWARTGFSILGTLLLSSVLYFQASGGLLTVSWGLQGLVLLSCGFLFRERVLRLQGLALFLICILKLFIYDLRNLETIYRILSFVVLGLILLSVSWIYTRFREQVRRLL